MNFFKPDPRLLFLFIFSFVFLFIFPSLALATLPPAVDNREYDTPIKNQQEGTCWAYATTAMVEAQFKKQTGKTVDLSEGYLVSCCDSAGKNPEVCGFCYGCGSCNGGSEDTSSKFIFEHGVVDQQCFDSEGCTSLCSEKCSDWQSRLYKTESFNCYGKPGVDKVKELVASGLPLTAFFLHPDFAHGAKISGYDDNSSICQEAYGVPGCWIIKNSWGVANGWVYSLWHEEGYLYLPYYRTPLGEDSESESIYKVCSVGAIIPPGPSIAAQQKIFGTSIVLGNVNNIRFVDKVAVKYKDAAGNWFYSQKYPVGVGDTGTDFQYEIALPPGTYKPYLDLWKGDGFVDSLPDLNELEITVSQGENKRLDLEFDLRRQGIFGTLHLLRNEYFPIVFDKVALKYKDAAGNWFYDQKHPVGDTGTDSQYGIALPPGTYRPALEFWKGDKLVYVFSEVYEEITVSSGENKRLDFEFDLRGQGIFGTLHILRNENTMDFNQILIVASPGDRQAFYFLPFGDDIFLNYKLFFIKPGTYSFNINLLKDNRLVDIRAIPGETSLYGGEGKRQDFEVDLRNVPPRFCPPPNICVPGFVCTAINRGIPSGQRDCASGLICCERDYFSAITFSPHSCCPLWEKCGGTNYGKCGFMNFFNLCDYCGGPSLTPPTPTPSPTSTSTPTPIPRSYCEGNYLVNINGLRQYCSGGCEDVDENPHDGISERARCKGFGTCGDCNTCLSADKSLCRTVYQEGVCGENGLTAPCCLLDQSCRPDFQYACGYADPNNYCHKCLRFNNIGNGTSANTGPEAWCTDWDLTCGEGGPAKPRTKYPPDGFPVVEDQPVILSWYSFGEGFKEKCGEKLPSSHPKWENCNGTWKWDSPAQCISQYEGGGSSDRDCWGYVCAKGSFGIPTDWRYYEVFIKKPGEADFSSLCKITGIPNPSKPDLGWVQTIPEEKKSCSFLPDRPGEYQWYVRAGYGLTTQGGASGQHNDSLISKFTTVGNPNLRAVCKEENGKTKVILSWDPITNATSYAVRIDNKANGWDGSCGKTEISTGDICIDRTWGTSYEQKITKGQQYSWWIHPVTTDNIWGDRLSGEDFICDEPIPTVEISSTLTPIQTSTLAPAPTPFGQCETCRLYSANSETLWQEINPPFTLKKGQEVYIVTKGESYNTGTQNIKARFRINGTAEQSWCNKQGLILIQSQTTNTFWCETTLKYGGYFYIPYQFNSKGKYLIQSMLFNQETGWY